MSEVAEYLMKNYYTKYKKVTIPNIETLERAINLQSNHIVIVRDDRIRGIAVFLKLDDDTYKDVENWTAEAVLQKNAEALFKQNGDNIHFIILAAEDMHTILAGLRLVIKKENPKTISWWSPDNKKLHRRKL